MGTLFCFGLLSSQRAGFEQVTGHLTNLHHHCDPNHFNVMRTNFKVTKAPPIFKPLFVLSLMVTWISIS